MTCKAYIKVRPSAAVSSRSNAAVRLRGCVGLKLHREAASCFVSSTQVECEKWTSSLLTSGSGSDLRQAGKMCLSTLRFLPADVVERVYLHQQV